MLYLISALEAENISFDSSLKSSSHILKNWLRRNQIYMLYTCPSRRCLESIGPYVLQRKTNGEYVRAEIRFELCDRVLLPEQKPHALDVEYIRSFGMQPQNVLGVISGPEPSENDFERRVVEWFTNDFLEKYRDAPNPTAIVADGAVLAPIMKFLHRRQKVYSIPSLTPGQAVEYKSDGLNLSFSSILAIN